MIANDLWGQSPRWRVLVVITIGVTIITIFRSFPTQQANQAQPSINGLQSTLACVTPSHFSAKPAIGISSNPEVRLTWETGRNAVTTLGLQRRGGNESKFQDIATLDSSVTSYVDNVGFGADQLKFPTFN